MKNRGREREEGEMGRGSASCIVWERREVIRVVVDGGGGAGGENMHGGLVY